MTARCGSASTTQRGEARDAEQRGGAGGRDHADGDDAVEVGEADAVGEVDVDVSDAESAGIISEKTVCSICPAPG